MGVVTKPIMLDETGQRIADSLEAMVAEAQKEEYRGVSSLTDVYLANGSVIEAIGIPQYVSDVSEYSAYGITDPGWYVFARIPARDGVTVTSGVSVLGAAGYVAEIGADHIDVAVRFGVAAESQKVAVDWVSYAEIFTFKATDLAVRNLDYRVTFYVYEADEFATWTYALTADETFAEGRSYYLLQDGEYVKADVVYGDPVPADTYYVHSKLRFEGMAKNITYRFDEVIDCPVEFVLPAIEDDCHGAWFELRLKHNGSYSSTLIPPSDDVKIATQHTQAETAGLNMINLHYTSVGGSKVWRFMNTHSTFTETAAELESVEFRTPPTKLVYSAGETLDLAGAEVVAAFSDGTRKLVTADCTYSPAAGAALTAEDTALVASYTVGEVTRTASVAMTVS